VLQRLEVPVQVVQLEQVPVRMHQQVEVSVPVRQWSKAVSRNHPLPLPALNAAALHLNANLQHPQHHLQPLRHKVRVLVR
jgi:hypothetical protein